LDPYDRCQNVRFRFFGVEVVEKDAKDAPVVARMKELSAQFPRYGYRALPLLGCDRKRRAGRTRCGPTTSCSIIAQTVSSSKWELHH
jgi:hypothetical protein